MRLLGLLHSAALDGVHGAYDLVHGPMALVHGVCTDPKSHDFFLVPLSSVTPFVAEAPSLSHITVPEAQKMATEMEKLFNRMYGGVKRGLFNILNEKKVIRLDVELEEW